jgi:hypothetical protein
MAETNDNQGRKTAQTKKLERKLDAVGWGLFFIWIGIAVLADVGWGVGCIGTGLIIFATLAVREYLSGSACSGTTKAGC